MRRVWVLSSSSPVTAAERRRRPPPQSRQACPGAAPSRETVAPTQGGQTWKTVAEGRWLLRSPAAPTSLTVAGDRTQLPLEAVRDLLGIVRALYLAWQAEGRPDLAELGLAGRELRDALDLARRTEPDTVGHRAAWSKAERATERLGRIVAEDDRVAPLVKMVARRVGY
jgi:hypothetical protein